MFKKICSILYDWDPILLKEAHVLEDEYSSEAQMILSVLNKDLSNAELAQKIYDIFRNQFGEELILFKAEDCLTISNLILSEYNKSFWLFNSMLGIGYI